MIKQVAGQTILKINVSEAEQKQGQLWGTAAREDNAFQLIIEGVETSEDGKLQGSEGTWRFANGTGMLVGISGGGTYKGTAWPGGIKYEIAGQYHVDLRHRRSDEPVTS